MMKNIQLNNADISLFPVFEAVLDERHVGRAASRLNVTSSAVSHSLGRLRALLNDPLFLKTPKGVVPTARALELAEPIADILARARRVIATAEPFDPATSKRRFTIGMPDATAAVLLPKLLEEIGRIAPNLGISTRYLQRDTAVAELDARVVDIAIVPLDDVPARFIDKILFDDDFVIASRAGHSFTETPTLAHYCDLRHLIVSLTGDPHAYIDDILAERGLARRIASTVPNFMLALAMIAQTDLIAALPRGFVAMHGPRFGVVGTDTPLPFRRFEFRAIAPHVAMMDAGLEWLFGLLERMTSQA